MNLKDEQKNILKKLEHLVSDKTANESNKVANETANEIANDFSDSKVVEN